MLEFKKLELKQEGSWIKRQWQSAQVRKTLLAMLVGSAGGFIYFLVSKHSGSWDMNELLQNVGFGTFIGFFVTNSPCAKGGCSV